MEAGKNLNDFVVGSVPTLIYIPDFITDSEQNQLVNNICQAPLSKWKSLNNRRLQNWGGVVHEKGLLAQDLPPWLTRTTQRIFEESGLFPSPINHVLINEYLPNQGIMPHQDGPAYFPVVAILSLGSPVVMDFTPHSSLRLCTNALRDNVEDKNSYGGASDIGTDKWLDNHHPFSVLLMPRSLLIFKDKAYSDYLHGIKDSNVQQYDGAVNVVEALKHHRANQPLSGSEKAIVVEQTGDSKSLHRTANRISLTCRMVSKVHKNLFKF
uniref:Fe2OG dioxygenase domain-containing protein n=1 Tax=Davidia involucrata TaxID=16924 RepID=A0A5B7BKW1_DAVIN